MRIAIAGAGCFATEFENVRLTGCSRTTSIKQSTAKAC